MGYHTMPLGYHTEALLDSYCLCSVSVMFSRGLSHPPTICSFASLDAFCMAFWTLFVSRLTYSTVSNENSEGNTPTLNPSSSSATSSSSSCSKDIRRQWVNLPRSDLRCRNFHEAFVNIARQVFGQNKACSHTNGFNRLRAPMGYHTEALLDSY